MNKKLALYIFKENRKLKRKIKELEILINEKSKFKGLLTVKENNYDIDEDEDDENFSDENEDSSIIYSSSESKYK